MNNSEQLLTIPHKHTPDPSDGLIELIDTLDSIDTSNTLSKLNETTIVDRDGSRIVF